VWKAHGDFLVGRSQATEGALKNGSASGADCFPCLPTGELTKFHNGAHHRAVSTHPRLSRLPSRHLRAHHLPPTRTHTLPADLHVSVHLTSCTHEASLDQAITTVTFAAPFLRRPSLQASSLRCWPLSGPRRLRRTPTDSCLSRAARSARSTCTSKTWPRLP